MRGASHQKTAGYIDWYVIKRDLYTFNDYLDTIKGWTHAKTPEEIDTKLNRLTLDSLSEDRSTNLTEASHPFGMWITRYWGDRARKDLSSWYGTIQEHAKVLGKSLDDPDKYEGIAPFSRWVSRLVELMVNFAGRVNSFLQEVGPEKFRYKGLPIENLDHLPDHVVKALLGGIDYMVSLFKKRGVSPLLLDTVKVIVFRGRTKDERSQGLLGLYYPSKETVEILADVVAAKNPRMLKTWVQEVFVHELGHHLHMSLLPRAAKEYWDSGWVLVDKAKKETEERIREIQTVRHSDRQRFWDILFKVKGNLRAVRLKGIQRMKFHGWLQKPTTGSPLVTPKQLRWSKDGKWIPKFLSDPEGYMAFESGDGRETEYVQEAVRRLWKVLNDKLAIGSEYSGYTHPFLTEQDVEKYRKEDPSVDKALAALAIPTDYGQTNFKEDFAETFVAFMDAPGKLSDTAKYRMQRTLSLASFYGKPLVRVGSQRIRKLAIRYLLSHTRTE